MGVVRKGFTDFVSLGMALITQILFWVVLSATLQLRPTNSYGDWRPQHSPGPFYPKIGDSAILKLDIQENHQPWPPRPSYGGLPLDYEKRRPVLYPQPQYQSRAKPSYVPKPYPKNFNRRVRWNKPWMSGPKCAAEGNKCDKDDVCCDNMKCTGSKGQGGDCDLAIDFDSEKCKGRTCKRNKPPKCIEEGNECNDEQKCCDDLKCTGGKGQGDDCDLALAFDSEKCKKKKRTCEIDEPQPAAQQCIEEGNECNDQQKCCDDLKCTRGKGQGDDCDL